MMPKFKSEIPSGSNWGSNELDLCHFEQKSRLYHLEDFPWRGFSTVDDSDPIEDISESIELLFGATAEEGNSPQAIESRQFFKILNSLKGRRNAPNTTVFPQTRSRGPIYSSSPLTFNYDAVKIGQDDGEREEFASQRSEEAAQIPHTGQKTPPKRTKKRRLDGGFKGHRVRSPLSSVKDEVEQDEDLYPLSVLESERSHSQSLTLEDNVDLGSAVQQYNAPSSVSNPPGEPFVGQHFPSSQTDSTYLGEDDEIQDSPTLPTPKEKQDQAEDSTNFMMNTLLIMICNILTTKLARPELMLYVTLGRAPLVVPVNGEFPTTKPDLAIKLDRNGTELTILDYEDAEQGKRLKMSMKAVQKFGQQVAHLLGRARYNMSIGEKGSRIVYLISAQHSSVSILRCTSLKRKWLDLLADNVKEIEGTDRRRVEEYGPVDLNNADESVLFVKMVCRLLIYLMERSSIWQDVMKESSLEQDKDKREDKEEEKSNVKDKYRKTAGKEKQNSGRRSSREIDKSQAERQREQGQKMA